MISTLRALFFSTPLLAGWKQSFDLIEVGFLIAARWGLCHLCLGVVHDAGPGALIGDLRKWGSSEGGQGVWRDTILQYSDEFWCRKTSPWYSYLLEVRQASAEPWDPKGDFLCARLGEPCSEQGTSSRWVGCSEVPAGAPCCPLPGLAHSSHGDDGPSSPSEQRGPRHSSPSPSAWHKQSRQPGMWTHAVTPHFISPHARESAHFKPWFHCKCVKLTRCQEKKDSFYTNLCNTYTLQMQGCLGGIYSSSHWRSPQKRSSRGHCWTAVTATAGRHEPHPHA